MWFFTRKEPDMHLYNVLIFTDARWTNGGENSQINSDSSDSIWVSQTLLGIYHQKDESKLHIIRNESEWMIKKSNVSFLLVNFQQIFIDYFCLFQVISGTFVGFSVINRDVPTIWST